MQFKLKGRDTIDLSRRKTDDLVFIGLFTTRLCNLNCIYCFEDSGKADENELSKKEKLDIISNASDMGAKVLFIPGAGEPLLGKDTDSMIELAYSHQMTTILYSNATLINIDRSRFFYEHDVTPILKLESLKPETHDYLTNTKGSFEQAMRGIENLLDAGYRDIDDNVTRIGISCLYTSRNIEGILDIYHYCSKNNIKLIPDVLRFHGRAKNKIKELIVEPERIRQIQKIIERESKGNVSTAACICRQYGITIDHVGEARYCTEMPTNDIGSIRDYSLRTLVDIKNRKYPPGTGCFTCPVKEKTDAY